MSTQKVKRQPLSDKHKLIITIIAIVLAAVIAVSVTLIVLLQPKEVTPDPNDPNNNPSSNLPVKNGDFGLVNSDATTFPKTATNWTRYGYEAPNGGSQGFKTIESNQDVIMGIVDTEDWDNVVEGVKGEISASGKNPDDYDLTNPGQYTLPEGEKHSNSNVYLISTVNKTSAAIMSDSVSISATTSVKITVRINTSKLKAGDYATIMIQQSSSTPNAKEENRYAYKYDIEAKDGWQTLDFHVFNRKTSSQSVRVCVGIGNVYTGVDSEGTIYIDNISYETVTSDVYRQAADLREEGDTTFKIIEKEEATTTPAESYYIDLKAYGDTATEIVKYTNSTDYVNAEKFSPFTDKDDFFKDAEKTDPSGFAINKIVNNGTIKTPVAVELDRIINLKLDENNYEEQDYKHVSFWVRTKSIGDNKYSYANIIVEKATGENSWEKLSDDAAFVVKTEQDIEHDTNNGWTKYDIYLKPSTTSNNIRIVFSLGRIDGYEGLAYAPNGELFITTPYYETISNSAYSSASSSSVSKKFDLTGKSAETSVTNGSFSNMVANTKQPSNWTPVFAGDNAIYLDGKGDLGLGNLSTDKAAVAGSGTANWKEEDDLKDTGYIDDDEGKVLKLVSNQASSFGYISGNISLTKHTAYVFSVMAKVGTGAGGATARPYFYLLNAKPEQRENAIIAQVNNFYSANVNGDIFCMRDGVPADSGWARYYIVYVTGNEDTSVRIALFNGSMTDANGAAAAGSTIYYDNVKMKTLGTYSMVEDEENEDATEYVVKFSAASDFAENEIGECENVEQLVAKMKEVLNNNADDSVAQPTESEWTEMKKIPEPSDDDEDDEEPDTPAEKKEVNLALLFSILSSVLLVAALAVVVVLKIYRNRKRNA